MLIGAGDLGIRVANSLMLREKVDEMTLVDLPGGGGPSAAEYMRCCNTIPIHFEGVNCLLGLFRKIRRRFTGHI
jgi:hypothetical protein